MNKKLFYLMAILGAMVAFAPACGDADPCKDVDCGPNGDCFDGICICAVGYEGDGCLTEWSAKFVASSYSGGSTCLDPSETYQGSITRLSATTIRINEFGGFTGTNHIDAEVALPSSSDVSATAVKVTNYKDGFNRTFNGTGSINGNVLTINYTVDYNDGGPIETCIETLTLSR